MSATTPCILLDVSLPAVQLVIVTVLLVAVLGFWVRSHSSMPGKHWYLLSSTAMVWWLLSVGFELSTQSVDCAVMVGQSAWVGIVLLPTFWAFFLYEYALGARVSRRAVILGAAVAPVVITLAAATTGWHQSFYGPGTRLVTDSATPYVYFDHGPLFFGAIGYLYFVIMPLSRSPGVRCSAPTPPCAAFS